MAEKDRIKALKTPSEIKSKVRTAVVAVSALKGDIRKKDFSPMKARLPTASITLKSTGIDQIDEIYKESDPIEVSINIRKAAGGVA